MSYGHALALLPQQPFISFEEKRHRYTYQSPGGPVKAKSVSRVLSFSGAKPDFDRTVWINSLVRRGMDRAAAEQHCEDHSQHRANVGKTVHKLIETYLLGTPPPAEDETSEEAAMLYERWYYTLAPRITDVVVIELPMIHRAGFYSGTPDLVAKIDGRWMIDDHKTQEWLAGKIAGRERLNALHGLSPQRRPPEPPGEPGEFWPMQLGAYARILEDEHDLRVDGGMNGLYWADGHVEIEYSRAQLDGYEREFRRWLIRFHELSILALQAEKDARHADGGWANPMPLHVRALSYLRSLPS